MLIFLKTHKHEFISTQTLAIWVGVYAAQNLRLKGSDFQSSTDFDYEHIM